MRALGPQFGVGQRSRRLQHFQGGADHARRSRLPEQRPGVPAQSVEVGLRNHQRPRRQVEIGEELGQVEVQDGALLGDRVALLGNGDRRIDQVEPVGRLLLHPQPGVCQVTLGERQALLLQSQRNLA